MTATVYAFDGSPLPQAKTLQEKLAVFADLPLRQAAPLWLSTRTKIAPKTRWCYEKCYFVALLAELGELPLRQIHIGHLVEYRKKRQETAGPSTINHEISALQQILKKAGLWEANFKPWYEPLPLPKTGPGRALEPDQERRLWEAAKSRGRWRVAYCCSLITANTTAGPGEVRNLRLKDVHLDANPPAIYVREGAKNQYRERTLPLNENALWAVKQLLELAKAKGATGPDHYLLPRRGKSGQPPDPTRPMGSWKKAWYSLTQAAGLKGLRRYDLRHHAISKLLERSDVSDETVRALAGHVSHKMMEHYSHIRLERKTAAVNTLSRPDASKSLETAEQQPGPPMSWTGHFWFRG